jgi:Holliday junction resolvasome RuvABC endonuclease subunit
VSIADAVASIAPGRAFGFGHVAGVDPSLTGTGLALVSPSAFVVTKLARTAPAKTLRGTDERIRYITGLTVAFIPRGSLVLIEKLFVPQGKGMDGSLIERAGLWWFLVDQLLHRDCEVVPVQQATRAKLATGNGNSKKADVTATMRSRFPGVQIPDDNVADALALAAAAAHWAGFPADGPLDRKQNEAMTAVAWPSREER